MIIIIIIISIFKEDNVFSITASLPYGPPVNTDIDYNQTFSDYLFFASVARLVVRYFVLNGWYFKSHGDPQTHPLMIRSQSQYAHCSHRVRRGHAESTCNALGVL